MLNGGKKAAEGQRHKEKEESQKSKFEVRCPKYE